MSEQQVEEPIAFTERYVVHRGTRRELASAWVGHLFRLRSTWIVCGLYYLVAVLLWLLGFDDRGTAAGRWFWAAVLAVPPTVVLAVVIALIGYVRILRGSRAHLYDGAVLESGFGEDGFVLRNPLASSRIRYRALRAVRVRGQQVFLRQHGSPLWNVCPRELFPDDALDRMRAHLD